MQDGESNREDVRHMFEEQNLPDLRRAIGGMLKGLTPAQRSSLGEDPIAEILDATAARALERADSYRPDYHRFDVRRERVEEDNANDPRLNWLRAVARSCILRRLKEDRRQDTGRRDYSIAKRAVYPKVDSRDVEEILGSLPGTQGEALRRRYIEGFSTREVAEELRMNENATRQLVYRGRQSFRARW